MCYDRGGRTLGLSCFGKRVRNLCKIMSVDFNNIKIKCPEFIRDRIRRADVFDFTVNLKTVIINDHAKVIQFPVTCKHGCFPDLAFLNFSVSQKCIYTVILVLKFRGKCHAACGAQSLSQGSGRHINARNMFHIRMSLDAGMTLQSGAEFTKCF